MKSTTVHTTAQNDGRNIFARKLTWAIIVLAGIVAAVSLYANLFGLIDLATQVGLEKPWTYPIIVDGSGFVYSVALMIASILGHQSHKRYAGFMLVVFALVTVYLAAMHAPSKPPVLAAAPEWLLGTVIWVSIPVAVVTSIHMVVINAHLLVAERLSEVAEADTESAQADASQLTAAARRKAEEFAFWMSEQKLDAQLIEDEPKVRETVAKQLGVSTRTVLRRFRDCSKMNML